MTKITLKDLIREVEMIGCAFYREGKKIYGSTYNIDFIAKEAAQRLKERATVTDEEIEKGVAALLKDDPVVFSMLDKDELRQSVRAVLEAVRK